MNGKKIIICIVGKSGSGKTTLGRMLCKITGYNWICSYTTRNIRQGEKDGIDHFFVDCDNMPQKKEMMAYTLFGGNHYWTLFEQFSSETPNVYVIDEKGLFTMEETISRVDPDGYKIVKVYVDRKGIDVDSDRIARDDERVCIPESDYDVVIRNEGRLDLFLLHGTKDIKRYVENIEKTKA